MAVDLGDFVLIGDEGLLTIVTEEIGFGEGGFGEGPFGGSVQTVTISGGTTAWTDIETP